MSQGPVKEPAMRPADTGHASLVDDHAALFVGEPQGTDVEQQHIGDCFFLASLASLAQRRPEAIEAAVSKRGEGAFAVRFFRFDRSTDEETPHEVLVNREIPEKDDRPIYATTKGDHGLWVSIFEKAFASVRGSFGKLDRGGNPDAAIRALTGKPAHITWLEGKTPDDIWTALEHAVAARQITVAATFTDDEARNQLAILAAEGKDSVPAHEREAFSYAHLDLVASHEYSVWALSGPGEGRSITLRNPWGQRTLKSATDDGIFSLPFHQFMLVFAYVCVGG